MKKRILSVLKQAKGIVVGAHTNPDGDAIGALIGIATLCGFLHIPYTILLENTPKAYENLLKGFKVSNKPLYPFDTFVSVDCGDLGRLIPFDVFFKEAKTPINIDHHITNTEFAIYNEVKEKASSTCEIIFELLKESGCCFTEEVVAALYVGILTDTGGFMHRCTSSHTHEIASELLSYDLDFTKLYYTYIYEKTEMAAKMEAIAIFNIEKLDQ